MILHLTIYVQYQCRKWCGPYVTIWQHQDFFLCFSSICNMQLTTTKSWEDLLSVVKIMHYIKPHIIEQLTSSRFWMDTLTYIYVGKSACIYACMYLVTTTCKICENLYYLICFIFFSILYCSYICLLSSSASGSIPFSFISGLPSICWSSDMHRKTRLLATNL